MFEAYYAQYKEVMLLQAIEAHLLDLDVFRVLNDRIFPAQEGESKKGMQAPFIMITPEDMPNDTNAIMQQTRESMVVQVRCFTKNIMDREGLLDALTMAFLATDALINEGFSIAKQSSWLGMTTPTELQRNPSFRHFNEAQTRFRYDLRTHGRR